MIKSERFSLPQANLEADTNVRYHYPINSGTWIVNPGVGSKEDSFCRYRLKFKLESGSEFNIHVSADNRFELRCDGEYIGMGPDRSDIDRWSFHSYRLALDAGHHVFEAEVHFLHKHYPFAQTSIEPGFVLYSEDAPVDLNTGSAPWKSVRLRGVGVAQGELRTFCVVGPNYTIEAKDYFASEAEEVPVVLQKAGCKFGGGNILKGWKLYPSRLPEQVRRPVNAGRVRVVGTFSSEKPIPVENGSSFPEWQEFVTGRGPVTVPAGADVTVIWDLDDYFTAYPELTVDGGEGGFVEMHWAESCFKFPLVNGAGKDNVTKENRDEIAGKFFRGIGDEFRPDGEVRTFRPFWWRSGRYIRIRVRTAGAPMILKGVCLMESRLPLENESSFACDDDSFSKIIKVSVRGLQMCAHETYMDCPYYEQMMYVGDTRIQVLTSYVMSAEDRLNQRALELFDWSRRETGFVLERHPSRPKQLSCTFAMIWIMMLRDYCWWRNDAAFMKKRLKGMRCLLEEFKELQGDKELIPALPGWSFMDWVEGLSFVNNPGPDETVSAVVNLLFINALNAAADVEEAHGEPHLAQYDRAWAGRLAAAVDRMFWDKGRRMFAETPGGPIFSEHAQCLAILSGMFPEREKICFESLISADDLLRTTVYFSYYLLEAFAKMGRGDLILKKFDFWKDMVSQGFKTPVETPEPSRSDCHAWGSHPLFHMHASLAGIRPAAPGFAEVRIEPHPGGLNGIDSCVPHPAGEVFLKMERKAEKWKISVKLPEDVPGRLCWQGREYEISGTLEI